MTRNDRNRSDEFITLEGTTVIHEYTADEALETLADESPAAIAAYLAFSRLAGSRHARTGPKTPDLRGR